jgi:transposase
MEDHPVAVIEKAKRLEQLLQRVAQGEPLERGCAALDLAVEAQRLAQLQAQYAAGGRTWEALIDGRYGHPIKAHSALREWLYERKRQDQEPTAAELVDEVQDQFGVALSAGHINYLLRKVELTRPPGRPPHRPAAEAEPAAAEPEPPSHALDNAGIFFPGSRKTGPGRPAGGGDVSGERPPAGSGRKPCPVPAGGGE